MKTNLHASLGAYTQSMLCYDLVKGQARHNIFFRKSIGQR